MTGTQTLSARGVTWEYILLDFTSVGGKKRRRIAVEGALTCAFDGAVVARGLAETRNAAVVEVEFAGRKIDHNPTAHAGGRSIWRASPGQSSTFLLCDVPE